MCKSCTEHFKKYNQWYSMGLLLIITLLLVLLFLKIEALEIDVDKQVNQPGIDHQLTVEQLKKKQATETAPTGETLPLAVPPAENPPTGAQ